MSDYGKFAPNSINLSDVAQLLHSGPAQRSLYGQQASRPIAMQGPALAERRRMESTFNSLLGQNDANNQLAAELMMQGLATDQRGQDVDMAKAMVNKMGPGALQLQALLGPAQNVITDIPTFLDRAGVSDQSYLGNQAADTGLKDANAAAAPINAQANMVRAKAAQTAANNGMNQKWKITQVAPGMPPQITLNSPTLDPSTLLDFTNTVEGGYNNIGQTNQDAATDFSTLSTYAAELVNGLNQMGDPIVDKTPTDDPNLYIVHTKSGKNIGIDISTGDAMELDAQGNQISGQQQ